MPAVEPPSWSALAVEAEGLRSDLGRPRCDRERWFAAQLAAVATTCRVRGGASLPWTEQVERCLHVQPEPGELDVYAAAHTALDGLLPGPEPLAERYERHRAQTAVPGDRLPDALRALVPPLRARVPHLPAGERLTVRGVSGASWTALCRSQGGPASEVLVSTSRALPAASVVALAAHETYPGHHLERCRLAAMPERDVAVVATPEAVVTEGLGETALRASGLTVQECGPVLGLDLRLAGAVAAAAAPLTRTKTDAALLLHSRGPQAAAEHLSRWGLHSPARVDAQLAFLTDPTWSVHAVAYGAGAALVGRWLDGGGSYADLHGRPVTPALLEAGP